MDFSVNNNGIQKVDASKIKQDGLRPDSSQEQGENIDYTGAYSSLGTASRAAFIAGQRVDKKSLKDKLLKETGVPFKDGNDFISSLTDKQQFTDEECNKILSNLGMPLSKIKSLRAEIKNFNKLVELLPIMSRYSNGEFDVNKASLDELTDFFTEYSDLPDVMNLFTDKNVKFVQDSLNIHDKNSAQDFLLSALTSQLEDKHVFNKHFVKACQIHNIAKGPIDKYINDLNFSEIAGGITLEQVKSAKMLADAVGETFSVYDAQSIKDVEKITPEFIEEYKNIYEKFKNMNIEPTFCYGDPVEELEQFKDVYNRMQDCGLDLSWVDKENGVRLYSIKQFLESEFPKQGKLFIDLSSDDWKKTTAPSDILNYASLAKVAQHPEGYVELFKALSSLKTDIEYYEYTAPLAKRHHYNLVNVMPETTDVLGFANFIKACDEAGAFPTKEYFDNCLKIKDNNYKGACDFVKKLSETFKNQRVCHDYIVNFNADLDFDKSVKVLDNLKKQGLQDGLDRYTLDVILSSNDENQVSKYKLLKQLGCNEYSTTDLLNESFDVKKLEKKIEKFLNGTKNENPHLADFDNDFIWKALNYKHDAQGHAVDYLLRNDVDAYSSVVNPSSLFNSVTDFITPKNQDFLKQLYVERPNDIGDEDILDAGKFLKWAEKYRPQDYDDIMFFARKAYTDKTLKIPPLSASRMCANISNSAAARLGAKLLDDKRFNTDYNTIYDILILINRDKFSLADKLCFDKNLNFPKESIADFLGCVNNSNFDLAEDLVKDDNYKLILNDIPTIMREVRGSNQKELFKKLYYDKELNFPKECIGPIFSKLNAKNIDLAIRLCLDKNWAILPQSVPLFLNVSEPLKLETLLNDSSMINWAKTNIMNGISPDTVLALAKTQQKFNRDSIAEEQKDSAKIDKAQKDSKPILDVESEDIDNAQQVLVDMGVHPKMAPNYIKMCQKNGVVDRLKLEAVCQLAKVGVPFKEFKNIFNIAVGSPLSNANGQFRLDIVKYVALLKKCGVDDIKLATNLAATLNMSDIELHSRLNLNIRNDMVQRLEALPNNVITNISESGIDLVALKEKATKIPKTRKINKDLAPETPIVLRSLDSIVGVEKIILNKYKHEVPQEVWANPERFKKWAKDKLEQIVDFDKNPHYKAVDNYAVYNNARRTGIEKWYKYLTEESNYKEDVFTHLLVMDGITRDMRPHNAITPPAISHESFEATYNALLQENTKVSFDKLYTEQTKAKAIEKYAKAPIQVEEIKGRWVSIPKTKKSAPEYDENIAMVQALADGSCWCLRFESAHNYLQKGNVHYFLDDLGRAQVAVNETAGQITEIQKRYDQDSSVPVPYAKVVDSWARENNYSGKEYEINVALDAKQSFDELKSKLTELLANDNSFEALKLLGFEPKEMQDGLYYLTSYSPKCNRSYTLYDLHIDENKLAQNVGYIAGGLDLEGSRLTALPNLKSLGAYEFKNCNIDYFPSLESIAGKEIYWENKKQGK